MEPDAEPHVRLIAAVRAGSSSRVAAVGRLCASNGTLDKRVHSSHANNGPLLCALPHVFTAYQAGAASALEELLVFAINDELIDKLPRGWCLGGSKCHSQHGLTALQIACLRHDAESVRILLQLGARADLPMCFEVDADDMPTTQQRQQQQQQNRRRRHQHQGEDEQTAAEDDELTLLDTSGIAGYSALRLARHRSNAVAMALLEEHGGSIVDLSAHPTSECPICYEPLDDASAVITPCAHRFHAACLPTAIVRTCPLCRTPLPAALVHEQQASTQPAAELASSPAMVPTPLRSGGPTEPPWLRSPVFVQSAERVYTEFERRRL